MTAENMWKVSWNIFLLAQCACRQRSHSLMLVSTHSYCTDCSSKFGFSVFNRGSLPPNGELSVVLPYIVDHSPPIADKFPFKRPACRESKWHYEPWNGIYRVCFMLPNAILDSGMLILDFPSQRFQKKCQNRAIFETSKPIIGPISHCLGTTLHTGVRDHLAHDLDQNLGSGF